MVTVYSLTSTRGVLAPAPPHLGRRAQPVPPRPSPDPLEGLTSTIALLRRAKTVAYVRTPSMATHLHAQTDTQETNVKHHLYPLPCCSTLWDKWRARIGTQKQDVGILTRASPVQNPVTADFKIGSAKQKITQAKRAGRDVRGNRTTAPPHHRHRTNSLLFGCSVPRCEQFRCLGRTLLT
eukprot:COSAG01_NODE_3342_length_6229_cov_4.142088_5_plen_180_part_00